MPFRSNRQRRGAWRFEAGGVGEVRCRLRAARGKKGIAPSPGSRRPQYRGWHDGESRASSVLTLTFGVLYCFFIISHDRRRILHCNLTQHPTSSWIAQQLREAFPYDAAPKFLIFDHDAKYGFEVPTTIRSMNVTAVRTSVGCPWQNGVAERWVGSCRRELLDQVIVLNERHLRRLLSDYISYYHDDRTHLGLGKHTPGVRRPSLPPGQVVARPRLGGLHHRYDRAA